MPLPHAQDLAGTSEPSERRKALRSPRSRLSLAFFREAAWLTQRRVRGYATVLIAASAGMIAWLLTGHGIDDPLGRPVGTDFVSFWTVSWALLHDQVQAIYSPETLAALERTIEGGASPFYAWLYPPVALLVVYPLALLPYLWSLLVWLAAGATLYLTALWRILPRPLTLWVGLAFPAVLVTVEHGQNALLVAGLMSWALLLLSRRPFTAGILIGLLIFKPHLGLLIPLALIAGGHRRALIAAAVTGIVLAAVTIALFGAHVWAEYLSVMPLARDVLDLELVPTYKMQSVFAALRLLDAPIAAAYGVQALATLASALLVLWIWRQPNDQDLKNAVLVAATLLATPFVLDYDLMLLAPVIAWLTAKGLQSGALPWERIILAAACLDPLVARVVGRYAHIGLTPIIVVALLMLVVRRTRAGNSRICGNSMFWVHHRPASAGEG
jgi:alpha-1,2-mannosyltransferase